VLLTLAGFHELSHRADVIAYDHPAPPEVGDDTAEMAPVEGEPPSPRPVRGRWS
jgi:hypothetical protein